jgi:hypothetical protein
MARFAVVKTMLDPKIPPRHFIHESVLISTDPPSPAIAVLASWTLSAKPFGDAGNKSLMR